MPQDLVAAYMWLNLAAPENEEAARLRGSVEEKLSQDELALAQKRAAEWFVAFNHRKAEAQKQAETSAA